MAVRPILRRSHAFFAKNYVEHEDLNFDQSFQKPKLQGEGRLEEIEFTFYDDGRVKMHVMGIKGPECLEICNAFGRALGGKLIHSEPTHEFYEQPLVQDNTQTLYAEIGDEEKTQWAEW